MNSSDLLRDIEVALNAKDLVLTCFLPSQEGKIKDRSKEIIKKTEALLEKKENTMQDLVRLSIVQYEEIVDLRRRLARANQAISLVQASSR